MSSLVFPSLHVAAAGPTSETPAAAGLTDPPPPAFSFAGPNSDEASPESSSIGSLSSDDDDDDDDDRGAESKSSKDDSTGSSSLVSLSSLEDSLPIKKGLSSHFAGKSRSFSNLSECAAGSAGDLAKHENPYNKRRRIQIANKMSYKRRASCSSLITTVLPPLSSPEHALEEADEENDDDDDEGDAKGVVDPYNGKKINKASFKPPRSFSLFDLRYV